MQVRSFLINVVCVLPIALSGCSVQFPQLDALEEVRAEEFDLESIAYAARNMEWNGEEYVLYQSNISELEIIFAFETRLLRFSGFNLIRTRGFLPDEAIGDIQLEGENLVYAVDGVVVATHECDPWFGVETSGGGVLYRKECSGDSIYTNEVEMSPEGSFVRLQFLMHPGYPQMTMVPVETSS